MPLEGAGGRRWTNKSRSGPLITKKKRAKRDLDGSCWILTFIAQVGKKVRGRSSDVHGSAERRNTCPPWLICTPEVWHYLAGSGKKGRLPSLQRQAGGKEPDSGRDPRVEAPATREGEGDPRLRPLQGRGKEGPRGRKPRLVALTRLARKKKKGAGPGWCSQKKKGSVPPSPCGDPPGGGKGGEETRRRIQRCKGKKWELGSQNSQRILPRGGKNRSEEKRKGLRPLGKGGEDLRKKKKKRIPGTLPGRQKKEQQQPPPTQKRLLPSPLL